MGTCASLGWISVNSSFFVLAGVIGAAQLTGIGVLAAGYLSLDDIGLLFFCFTVPLGAALGLQQRWRLQRLTTRPMVSP
jgi:hypothetical protein